MDETKDSHTCFKNGCSRSCFEFLLCYLFRQRHSLSESRHGDSVHEVEDGLELPSVADVSEEDSLLGDGGEARSAFVEQLLVARGKDRQPTELSRAAGTEDLKEAGGRWKSFF